MTEKSKQEFMQKFLNNARKKALHLGGSNSSVEVKKQKTSQTDEIKEEDWLTK